ncbi:MAG: RecX family transcriptional regulator, partial [Cellulomonadaceae bacterium]|nr:RecX family transcriptional regulator [Cellulomonadaceae bacterium]
AIVRAKAEVRGMSRRAIAADLARRGISGEIAEESLSQIDEEAQHAVLAQFVGKVLARSGGLDRNTRLRRAVAAVQRKGYEPEQAYAAVLAGLAVECFPGEEVP